MNLYMNTPVEKSDLKVILHSKRANLYYLEKCRVMQKDGRVVYLTEGKSENSFWNIPIANTTVILLGSGTSITQAAMRLLSSAGVMVGFCGGGATPLFVGSEIEWLNPQSEYRPTQYIQGWLSFWFDEKKRLKAAKDFQKARLDYLKKTWEKDTDLQDEGIYPDDEIVENSIRNFSACIDYAENVTQLLTAEAEFTKKIYKYVATMMDMPDFVRQRARAGQKTVRDDANSKLDNGNYLAYGLAATTLWVLGIPHGFAVMHGKTRRGALVFDVADLVKDSIVLPWSFIASSRGLATREFRDIIIQKFTEHKSLDFMFDVVKRTSLQIGGGDEP